MAFYKHAKASFQALKKRNVMVRFTFLKDHLDILTKDKLEAKKKKKGKKQIRGNYYNSTDKKLWHHGDYETGMERELRGRIHKTR